MKLRLVASVMAAVMLAGISLPQRALAATYPCTESGLSNALAAGGQADFACSGSQTITVSGDAETNRGVDKNTTINVTSGSLTISGSDLYRLFIVNPNVTFSLRNVTLTNGRATDASAGAARGGAIFVNNGARLELNNVVMKNNQVVSSNPTQTVNGAFGGAIYNFQGTVVIIQSTLQNNQVTGVTNATGGAIYNAAPGSLDIQLALFEANFSVSNGTGIAEGGAISNFQGSMSLKDSVFKNNIALNNTTGNGRGGAIAVSSTGGSVSTIYNTFVQNNTAESTGTNGQALGGGIYNDPNGILSVKASTVQLNLARANNGTALGGGIFNNGGSVSIDYSVLANNSAAGASKNGSALAGVSPGGKMTYQRSVFNRFDDVLLCATPKDVLQSLGGNSFSDNSCPSVSSDSNPRAFAVEAAPPSATTTVNLLPSNAGNYGGSLAVQNNGTSTLAASLAALPVSSLIGQDGASLIGQDGASLIGQDGAGLMQVNLIGQDGAGLIGQDGAGLKIAQGMFTISAASNNRVTLTYYYPSTVTGTAEDNMNLYYNTNPASSGYAAVYSSGHTLPVKNTADNQNGTVSGGSFTVVFDMTSTPTVLQLTSVKIANIQGTVPAPTSGLFVPFTSLRAVE